MGATASSAGRPADGVRFDFTGRAAVVTGGTRGVGLAVVRALLGAGADVVTCGRRVPEGDWAPVVEGPDRTERRPEFVTADVRDAEAAAAVVEVAATRFGRVDLLVNNAGGSPAVAAAEASPRFFASVVNLNLLAPFYCAQAANRRMQEQPEGGAIVNIGSVSALRPSPGASAYGAAKAGLISLTQTLALEWAPAVRVNCVTAGLLDTGGGPEHYGGQAGLARVAATVPLGRMGTPDDVASACLFLASPAAAFVSGANLVLHGGGEWPAYLAAAQG